MQSSLQALTEIVEKIQIDRDLTISHPEYPALHMDPDRANQLQQIPVQLQRKYLITQIQNYLYSIYFDRSLMSLQYLEALSQQPVFVKNNIIDGVDLNFFQLLCQSNTGTGYLDPDWQIVSQTDKGELIVVKDGLHLHIDPRQHLPTECQQAGQGAIVSIYLPHNLMGFDTYIIVGSAGTPPKSPSVRVYFNFTPAAAPEIARALTDELNRLNIPFQFAILHNPALFHRAEAGTLWLSQAGYLSIQTFLSKLYHSHQTAFSPQTPLFSKQLAPGLGLVETPIGSDEFGMQRCQLVATGLVVAMERGQTATIDKLNTIQQEFTSAGIDLHQPYLNPSAVDCYGFVLKS
jgi:HopA1 effector protein family